MQHVLLQPGADAACLPAVLGILVPSRTPKHTCAILAGDGDGDVVVRQQQAPIGPCFRHDFCAELSLSLSLSLATSLHSNWRRTRACCVWMWPCVGQNDGWNDRARDAATYAACVQGQLQLLLQHAGGTVPRRTAAAALRPAGRSV
jgi:hypothetical protein